MFFAEQTQIEVGCIHFGRAKEVISGGPTQRKLEITA
jgi:hypothetical protein